MSSEITKLHPEVCEQYCSNISHGNLITAALTKSDVSDEALIYYMLSVCQHFSTARDSVGRSALHMAASCGRSSMVNWLVTYRNMKLEEKDRESGYTALHRSLFYGKINTAVALIKLGSNINALDGEGLTPLEHVVKDALESRLEGIGKPHHDRSSYLSCRDSHLGELYCWGSNSNYTLLGRHGGRNPELSHFHKNLPHLHINTIHLEKYHCIVTSQSKVYAWGHGLGGRLGLNTNSTVLAPEQIGIELKSSNTKHTHLDVARDHSIFLDVRNYVFTCGLNENSVLGVAKGDAMALLPMCVSSLKDKKIVGVGCGRYHSVAYSKDTLYTWGLNAGQLGHTGDCGAYVTTPKMVTRLLDGENDTIRQVCCSDGAIGILASNNVIYILHEFQKRRVAFKSSADFCQLHVYGGKLANNVKSTNKDKSSSSSSLAPHQQELLIAVVTETSNLLLWRESDPHLRRCVFSLDRPLMVSNIVLNARGCVFTTRDHEVFSGTFRLRKGDNVPAIKVEKDKHREREVTKSAFHIFLEKDECLLVKVEKVPKIHRACFVTSDPDGDNFIVLQNNRCVEFFYDVPSILKENFEMAAFRLSLRDRLSDESSLHDFKFHVGIRTFYCHKFILAHACTEMSKLVKKSTDSTHKVVDAIPTEIFEQMLEFIYTGSCELADIDGIHKKRNINKTHDDIKYNEKENDEFDSIDQFFREFKQRSSSKNSKDFEQRKLLLSCAKKFDFVPLQKCIEHYFEHNRSKCHVCIGLFGETEKQPVVQYRRKEFVDFSDIDVICKNGDKIKAHKCMLMRLEYFRNMFSSRWNQDRKSIKIDYPPLQVQQLVDFIYTDRLTDEIRDMDNLVTLLVLSDEFLVEKLRTLCEFSLCKHINMKTVVNLYQCSILYGACILKNICSQFIAAHLAELLELRSLDSIDDEHLVDISNIYLKHKSRIFDKRLITPFSYISVIQEPPGDFRLDIIEAMMYQAVEVQKVARKRSKRHKNSSVSDQDLHVAESTEILESESSITDDISKSVPSNCSSRILAITTAIDKLNVSCETDGEFTNLSMLSSSFDESEFPDLGNSAGSLCLYSKSPGKGPPTDWKSLPKLSQKARKRLQSEGSNTSSGSPPVQGTITNPWKTTFDVGQKDVSAIVKSERVQKGNLNKMRNKLLSSTQIEDRAIFELEKFYNIDNIEDELIAVRRVDSGLVASPTWVVKT